MNASLKNVQEALNHTATQVVDDAIEKKKPLYYDYEGYSIQYQPHRNIIYVELTSDVAKKLGISAEKLKENLEK